MIHVRSKRFSQSCTLSMQISQTTIVLPYNNYKGKRNSQQRQQYNAILFSLNTQIDTDKQ